ncbi:MAG: endonuclease V, partial [Bacteroidota bacterium]
ALERLTVWPDLLMLDGHGLAHPRRFGLACHLGLLLNQPALGVAKSRLTGVFAEPGPEKGDQQPLYARASDAERLGTVLRTRRQVQPVYVSPGHLISHEEAVHWTLACAPRFKIPEPTRQAHRLSKDGEVGQDG